MRRRPFLALLPAIVAGCVDDSRPSTARAGGKNYTAPPDVDVIDDVKEMPDPLGNATAESARSYVATYEERRIHNELLGEDVSEDHEGHVGIAGERDVVELEVEPATVELVRETDHGYYVLSSTTGSVEHWCSYDPPANSTRSCGSGAGRNASAVMHFVAPETHVRIPYDWYLCTGRAEPYRASEESENVPVSEHDPGAQVQVYDASEREHEVRVTVRYVDDGSSVEVYSETVETPPYLAVLTNIARRRGTYEIEAVLDTGVAETFEWEITDDDAPSWRGTSIFVTPTADLWIDTVAPADDLEFPSTSCPDALERTPDPGERG